MSRKVRGTSDVLSEEFQANQEILAALFETFASYGYRSVEVPVLERTELYLRKGGEQMSPFLYDFPFGNQRLCLRPELTASAVRLYVENLLHKPKPARLCFSGPVFRHEKPQRGRSRQFTQVGAELLGVKGTMADAEVIGLACHGLEKIGIGRYQAVIGNIGILNQFLSELKLDSRLQRMLLGQMEPLRREGAKSLISSLSEAYPELQAALSPPESPQDPAQTSPNAGAIGALLRGLDRGQARSVILDMFEEMHLDLTGNREPEEIVDRLLGKIERQNQAPALGRAIEFMQELGRLAGKPEEVFPEARRVVQHHGLDPAILDDFRELTHALEAYGVGDHVRVDLGLSRGLPYYTGVIFELYEGKPSSSQLCGGGRYDGLISTLGGMGDSGAAGFAFGLERLRLARRSELGTAPTERGANLLLAPVSPAEAAYAIKIAASLRAVGVRTELDVRGRSVTRNLQHALKQRIPFLGVVGSEEEARSTIFLKHLGSGQTWTVATDRAAAIIRTRDPEKWSSRKIRS